MYVSGCRGSNSNIYEYTKANSSRQGTSFLSQINSYRNDRKQATSSKNVDNQEGGFYIFRSPQLSASDVAKRDSLLSEMVDQGVLTKDQSDLIKSGLIPASFSGPTLTQCGESPAWEDLSGVIDLSTYYHMLFDRIPQELGNLNATKGYKTFLEALDEMLNLETT